MRDSIAATWIWRVPVIASSGQHVLQIGDYYFDRMLQCIVMRA